MSAYVILDNRDNVVLDIVDWDGQAPSPERAIDTTLQMVPAGMTPAVGQVWNGTIFVDPPAPAEPPVDGGEGEGGIEPGGSEPVGGMAAAEPPVGE